jgi:hypothetical protein
MELQLPAAVHARRRRCGANGESKWMVSLQLKQQQQAAQRGTHRCGAHSRVHVVIVLP